MTKDTLTKKLWFSQTQKFVYKGSYIFAKRLPHGYIIELAEDTVTLYKILGSASVPCVSFVHSYTYTEINENTFDDICNLEEWTYGFEISK